MRPFRILVLIWADALDEYALQILMIFLTSVWKLHFTHSAAIVNVYVGATKAMPIVIAFLAHSCVGNYWILLISSIAYSIGLSFLAVSTFPLLSKEISPCNAYQMSCISNPQIFLLYMSLFLIAIGKSGHEVSLGAFFVTNQTEDTRAVMQRDSMNMLVDFATVMLVLLIGGTTLPFIQTWSILIGFPAIFTVVATFLFWKGSSFYMRLSPPGSPLTTVLRVFVASALKIHLHVPRDSHQLYERHDLGDHLLPHTSGFSFLDKAAVTVTSQSLEEQEQNRWKLCRVTEVEKAKITLSMIPMWITFIICGLISSIGSTFFLEQASNMNRKVIGNLKLPLPIFLIFYYTAKAHAKRIYSKIESILGESRRRYAPPIGIAVAMMFSILCCITAARVEGKRLNVIKGYNTLDDEIEIPMSIFWLLPQFLLLAAFDEIFQRSLACFFRSRVPPSMMLYMMYYLTGVVIGAGTICGILSMHAANKISEKGGKPSWFQDTLNKSRLDNYYWTLAMLCSINLLFYVLVSLCYSYNDYTVEEEEEEEPEQEWMQQSSFAVETYREIASISYHDD